jgi:hypothetical protein
VRYLPTIAAVLIARAASADMLLRISDSVTVWNGGIAWTDGTNWYGQGWDRFPGVSPPWNPVAPEPAPPAPAPVAVTVAQPRPVRQEPPPRRLELGFNGEAVEISIRW